MHTLVQFNSDGIYHCTVLYGACEIQCWYVIDSLSLTSTRINSISLGKGLLKYEMLFILVMLPLRILMIVHVNKDPYMHITELYKHLVDSLMSTKAVA